MKEVDGYVMLSLNEYIPIRIVREARDNKEIMEFIVKDYLGNKIRKGIKEFDPKNNAIALGHGFLLPTEKVSDLIEILNKRKDALNHILSTNWEEIPLQKAYDDQNKLEPILEMLLKWQDTNK